MRTFVILAGLMLVAAPVLADSFTEGYEGGSNVGNWTFGNPADAIETEGGNPDAWFHNPNLDTFAPIFRTGYYGEMFTGNYVAMGVTQISGDFQTLSASNGTQGYPFALLLRNTYGNPNDVETDVYVYKVYDQCPMLDESWTHYDFAIPSDFEGALGELPEGWEGGSYWTGGVPKRRSNTSWPREARDCRRANSGRSFENWFWSACWSNRKPPGNR